MGTYLEAKQNEIAHLLKEKLYNSQRSTQSEYDTGKIMSLSDQASKLRYDVSTHTKFYPDSVLRYMIRFIKCRQVYTYMYIVTYI